MTTNIAQLSAPELGAFRNRIQERYDAFRGQKLALNLTRGKPSAAQLDLSAGLLSLPGAADFTAQDGSDCRNYGGLQGLAEARALFAPLLGATPEQTLVGNNSSLALMHDVIVYSLLRGTCDAKTPWSQQQPMSFLCPVPGYDRHFFICQEYGIRMITVPLKPDGPDMDRIEQLVANDPTIKGMWCMPKYSNPTGTVYSAGTVERLAKMKTAAADFRLMWDNAYAVHHLSSERVEIANILELCAKHGNPNRPWVFASTSKITLAGAGLGLFAASTENMKWLLKAMTPRTIGPDKLNQLRHVRFLRDQAGLAGLMDKHRVLLAPKFAKVLEVFAEHLGGSGVATWTEPKGGYFISLDVPKGCAKRVVSLAKDAGVELTPAGATFPFGTDPEDRNIRIAPTFPDLREVGPAATGVSLCVLLAAAEKLLQERK